MNHVRIRKPRRIARRVIGRDPGQHLLQLVLDCLHSKRDVLFPPCARLWKVELRRNAATRRFALETSTATS